MIYTDKHIQYTILMGLKYAKKQEAKMRNFHTVDKTSDYTE